MQRWQLFGIRHGKPDGKTLADLPQRGGGEWYTSVRFQELKIAKAWGLTPSQWVAASETDRAEMMAFEQSTAQMVAYEESQREK